MKMKISDILRKSSDETMAKIIGAVIAMQIDGISDEEAVELEYPHTLETLQSEMDVDYTPTNADRIRSMSDEELAEAIAAIGLDELEKIPFCNSNDLCTDILDDGKLIPESLCKQRLINWLQSEVEE